MCRALLLGICLSPIVLILNGCGLSSVEAKAPSPVSVSVSPSSGSLASGDSRQFDATIKGSSNTSVVWSATAGTISAAGVFTAPSVQATTNVVVTATSLADETKKASAEITVTAPVLASVSVAISPSSGSIESGDSRQFEATVKGTSNTGVAWSASAGNISTTGVFTAPSVEKATTVTVIATSLADETKKASAEIAVTQPVPVSVSHERCSNGTEGLRYTTCIIPALNGVARYSWTLQSGSLPGGLDLSTVGNQAHISGTPSATGTFNFVLKVTDSTAPTPGTASIPLSITIEGGPCGFPKYPCARNDWVTNVVSSMTTVPPDAGANHCAAGADGHLQSCGNIYGLNKIFTEPNYNNAKIVRVTDFGDLQPCMAGPGGFAGHNIFDSTSNYFVISCSGASLIKWFNPSAMQLNTSLNPQGLVVTSTGAVFTIRNQSVRAAFTTPGTFFEWTGTQVQSYTISSGVASSPTTVVDMANAIPCWSASSSTCSDWRQGSYGRNGANIIPLQNNTSPPHAFQLMNTAPCTTGSTYPNFSAAFGTPPFSTQVFVIADGTCQWADMGVPPVLGGRVVWTAGAETDKTDTIFNIAFSNRGGQDGAGACFGVDYDSRTNQYYHLNTCTGNVYTTRCDGGTGYACSGGTLRQIYDGNVYSDNQFSSGAINAVDIHNYSLSQNGKWLTVSFNNCALVDTSGNPVLCSLSGLDAYVFFPGKGSKLTDTRTLLGTGAPGHIFEGNEVLVYNSGTNFNPSKYLGKNVVTNKDTSYFDLSAGSCMPNTCWDMAPFGHMVRTVGWDEHGSWVTASRADDVPICMESYGATGAAGNSLWPAQYPWLGEVVCFATDGSNNLSRQAFLYNTQTSAYFSLQFNIGSYSSDGAWWAISSDWWCTLGNNSGGSTNLCGLPYQQNHAYSVGEYLGPIQMYAGVPGHIYQVTTAGTSGGGMPAADWCTTQGCTVTSGTAVFTYMGQNNAQPGVFLVKLQ